MAGRERFTVWRRVSDDESGQASLQVVTDHHVERGDLGYWYDSPRNIHRQWAEGDEASCLAIVLGGDGGDSTSSTWSRGPIRALRASERALCPDRPERLRFDSLLRDVYQFMRPDAVDLLCLGALGVVKVPNGVAGSSRSRETCRGI